MEVWIPVLVVLNLMQFVGLIVMAGALLYLHGEMRDLCRQVNGLASTDQIQAALVQHDALRRQGYRRPEADRMVRAVQSGGMQFHGPTNVNAPLAGHDQHIDDLPRPNQQGTPP
jgi:hypothetical protein